MTVALTGSMFKLARNLTPSGSREFSPVKIFELLAEAGEATPQQVVSAAVYADGAAHGGSANSPPPNVFERVAEVDGPSALFLRRANALRCDPPGPDWDPVSTLDGK